ncbi:MAG: hypothetical protein H6733_09735 [Alphaproteobacteria bacterium]|nr:hypothetical protein [Alphaproteobacteria bacterium]
MDAERTQILTARGAPGRLRLRAGERDTALLLDGLPVAMAWHDPTDPSWCYLVRAHDLSPLEAQLALPDLQDDTPLVDALRDVVELLGAGTYRLVHQPSPDLRPDVQGERERPTSSGTVIDWTGLHRLELHDTLLVGCMPRDLLDRRDINALALRIRQGERPPVVIVGSASGDVTFLVAGHGALEAYQRMGMQPNLVTVEVFDPEPLDAEEGADLLVAAYRHVGDVVAAHYQATTAVESAAQA